MNKNDTDLRHLFNDQLKHLFNTRL